jgi:MFS family permease
VQDDALDSEQEAVSQRAWMLAAVCLGLMVASFSATMVNMALPSIGSDLDMSDRYLAQILSVYVATFGGAMLIAGRLGDAFGHQRVFVLGVGLFAIASLGCGLAASPRMFIAWRSVQGFAGAIMSVLAQCLAANMFERQAHRAKALGLCSLVGASGASVGMAIGGALVSALDWRWIFFVNVPIAAVCAAALTLLPSIGQRERRSLDLRSMSVAIVLLVTVAYVMGNDNKTTWSAMWPVAVVACAGLLLMMFVRRRSSVQSTIARLGSARIRHMVVLNAVAAMLSVAALTWVFASTLYLQRVLGFNPMQVGLLFLPGVVAGAGVSLSIMPWLVGRFGVRPAAVIGLLSVGAGLTLLWGMPSDAAFLYDILPGMSLVAIGLDMSYPPLVHAALRGAPADGVGAASGLLNTSYMVGGALGLSALVSIAAGRTESLIAAGVDGRAALGGGYLQALGIGALIAFAAAVICAVALHDEAEAEQARA